MTVIFNCEEKADLNVIFDEGSVVTKSPCPLLEMKYPRSEVKPVSVELNQINQGRDVMCRERGCVHYQHSMFI